MSVRVCSKLFWYPLMLMGDFCSLSSQNFSGHRIRPVNKHKASLRYHVGCRGFLGAFYIIKILQEQAKFPSPSFPHFVAGASKAPFSLLPPLKFLWQQYLFEMGVEYFVFHFKTDDTCNEQTLKCLEVAMWFKQTSNWDSFDLEEWSVFNCWDTSQDHM